MKPSRQALNYLLAFQLNSQMINHNSKMFFSSMKCVLMVDLFWLPYHKVHYILWIWQPVKRRSNFRSPLSCSLGTMIVYICVICKVSISEWNGFESFQQVLHVIGVNKLASAQIPEFHTFIHLVFF